MTSNIPDYWSVTPSFAIKNDYPSQSVTAVHACRRSIQGTAFGACFFVDGWEEAGYVADYYAQAANHTVVAESSWLPADRKPRNGGPCLSKIRHVPTIFVVRHEGLEPPTPCASWSEGVDWTPYEMRHSAASLLIAMGVPIAEVADLFGHRDATTLMSVYRHDLAPAVDAGSSAIASVLTSAGAQPHA